MVANKQLAPTFTIGHEWLPILLRNEPFWSSN